MKTNLSLLFLRVPELQSMTPLGVPSDCCEIKGNDSMTKPVVYPSACSGSSSVGRGDCVVDGVSVQDPAWSNFTEGQSLLKF